MDLYFHFKKQAYILNVRFIKYKSINLNLFHSLTYHYYIYLDIQDNEHQQQRQQNQSIQSLLVNSSLQYEAPGGVASAGRMGSQQQTSGTLFCI